MIKRRWMVALVASAIVSTLQASSGARAEQRNFTIPVQEKVIEIGSGLKYDAWTYGGTVPGPILRVRQGDKVHIHLVNDMEIAHGIDIHAAAIAPSKHFAPVPGENRPELRLRCDGPGCFHVSLQRAANGYTHCQRHVWNDDRGSQGWMA